MPNPGEMKRSKTYEDAYPKNYVGNPNQKKDLSRNLYKQEQERLKHLLRPDQLESMHEINEQLKNSDTEWEQMVNWFDKPETTDKLRYLNRPDAAHWGPSAELMKAYHDIPDRFEAFESQFKSQFKYM